MIAAGIILLLISGGFTYPMLKPASDLTLIKGNLDQIDLQYKNEQGPYQESTEDKTELSFSLKGSPDLFIISEGNQNDGTTAKFDLLKYKIQNAQSLSVWIRPSSKDVHQPIVFRIDSEKEMLLDPDEIRFKNLNQAIWCFVWGVVLLFGGLSQLKKAGTT